MPEEVKADLESKILSCLEGHGFLSLKDLAKQLRINKKDLINALNLLAKERKISVSISPRNHWESIVLPFNGKDVFACW